jgi:bifunctional non-homologous end joining protein LigD
MIVAPAHRVPIAARGPRRLDGHARCSHPCPVPRKSTSQASVRNKLGTYRARRKFDVTREPPGDAAVAARPGWSFVVQKHAARRLHYDFRLELDGVLLSWSVPKGPSLLPGSRRLAVRTEDHPLDYRDFEGIIPAGEYGGGTVVVWDRGTWTPEGDPREAMTKGRLTFTLAGDKLRGRWHLVRTKMSGSGKAENWLLFKSKDDDARTGGDEIVDARPESVLTGRTVDQVARDADAVWHSNRSAHDGGAPDVATLVASLPSDRPFTHLDKVLWPERELTKAQLIAYLAVVSEHMLPHLAARPLTLVRCPDGHTGECWYQKHADARTSPSIHKIAIREQRGKDAAYFYIDDLRGLLAVAQLGALELHTWGARVDQIERPDRIVFDLDPDPTLGWDRVADGARTVRDALAAAGLRSWVKTTGGKGLHVCAPIARRHDWDQVKAFCRELAESVAAAAPDRYTTTALKAQRTGKIFIDYLRNTRGATFVAPYSPRRRAGAPVATPITWRELDDGIDPAAFTIETVPARLGALAADPWADLGDTSQSIHVRARRSARVDRRKA